MRIRRVEALQRRRSLFRRPPTFAPAALEACKPAVGFCRSEQASVAVAAVRILAELARTTRRHRTGLQRQARCFAQQIESSRTMHRRRTAHDARRDRDRAEIAAGVRSLGSRDWRGFRRGVLARYLAKQLFQYFDHVGGPVYLSFNLLLLLPRAANFSLYHTATVPQVDRPRRQARVSIAMDALSHAAVS
jgi:hypothetical protein